MKDSLNSCADVLTASSTFSREIKLKEMTRLRAVSDELFLPKNAVIVKNSVCGEAMLVKDDAHYLYQFLCPNEAGIITMLLFPADLYLNGFLTNDRLDNVLQHIQQIEVLNQEGNYADEQHDQIKGSAQSQADFLISSLH